MLKESFYKPYPLLQVKWKKILSHIWLQIRYIYIFVHLRSINQNDITNSIKTRLHRFRLLLKIRYVFNRSYSPRLLSNLPLYLVLSPPGDLFHTHEYKRCVSMLHWKYIKTNNTRSNAYVAIIGILGWHCLFISFFFRLFDVFFFYFKLIWSHVPITAGNC